MLATHWANVGHMLTCWHTEIPRNMANLLVYHQKFSLPASGRQSVSLCETIAERNPNLHTPVDVKGDHEQALQICSVKMKAFGSQKSIKSRRRQAPRRWILQVPKYWTNIWPDCPLNIGICGDVDTAPRCCVNGWNIVGGP